MGTKLTITEARQRDARLGPPRTITLDLASGFSQSIERCCDNPLPVVTAPKERGCRLFTVDFDCVSCGCTWVVAGWRLPAPD